jgi:hypothetical protein
MSQIGDPKLMGSTIMFRRPAIRRDVTLATTSRGKEYNDPNRQLDW